MTLLEVVLHTELVAMKRVYRAIQMVDTVLHIVFITLSRAQVELDKGILASTR